MRLSMNTTPKWIKLTFSTMNIMCFLIDYPHDVNSLRTHYPFGAILIGLFHLETVEIYFGAIFLE